jgi:hypothetical protein
VQPDLVARSTALICPDLSGSKEAQMSSFISRRVFLGSAVLAPIAVELSTAAPLPAGWVLTVERFRSPEVPDVLVTYSIRAGPSERLFVQVADALDPSQFFTWRKIVEPEGEFLFEVGPYQDLPYGEQYEVSIVAADGSIDPRSPVASIDVPPYPEDVTA